jgi:DNA-binding CsgD family transcriptional regulator
MLVGEPSIGKTAACEQICEFVLASCGRSLMGRCYEEGSFRPPYQAFVEAFTSYLQACDICTPAQPPSSARSSDSYSLTAREREIASQIAAGLTNREIAKRLVISKGTVEVHVKHVRSKLGYRSRSQVAGWFDRQHDHRSVDDHT